VTSGSSGQDPPKHDENAEEDLWLLWGKIINEWEIWSKKKMPFIKANNFTNLLIYKQSFSLKIGLNAQKWGGPG